MTPPWTIRRLSELAARERCPLQVGPFGSKVKAENYVESGVPYLRGANINDGRFTEEDLVFLDDSFAEQLRDYWCRPGDILLVHRGTIGPIGLVPSNGKYSKYVLGNSMLKASCDATKVNPTFVYYWFRSPSGQNYLRSRMSQTGVPAIASPLKTLREAPIPLPPRPEQDMIAKVLDGLESKIELNRRMNQTLEQIAQALFKLWFVDFGPVLAKKEGRWEKGESLPGMPADMWDLWPSEFEVSEVGEIPKGWEISSLGAELRTVLGGTPSRSNPAYWTNGRVNWINSGEVNRFRITTPSDHITEAAVEDSAAKPIPPHTTVIAITGATIGQVSITEIPTTTNQSVVAVIPTECLPTDFVYFWIRERIPDLLARQTGGAQQHINKNDANELPLLLPDPQVVGRYLSLAQPLFARITVSEFESLSLKVVRDAILPKLLSGEIRVRVDGGT